MPQAAAMPQAGYPPPPQRGGYPPPPQSEYLPPPPPQQPPPKAVPAVDPVAVQATEFQPVVEERRTLAGFLVSFQDDDAGKHWLLHQGDNLIGRAETKVGCGVPIANSTTSTRHAMLRCDGPQMTLTDLGSTNGTYRNDARLSPESAIALNDGDNIRFGGFTVRLMMAKR
jgi:hypothetical protein